MDGERPQWRSDWKNARMNGWKKDRTKVRMSECQHVNANMWMQTCLHLELVCARKMEGERTNWRDEWLSECQNAYLHCWIEQAIKMHGCRKDWTKKPNKRTNEWRIEWMPECLPLLVSWADLIDSLCLWRRLPKQAHVTWTHVPKFQLLELHILLHSFLLLQPDKNVGQEKILNKIVTIIMIIIKFVSKPDCFAAVMRGALRAIPVLHLQNKTTIKVSLVSLQN